MNKQTSLQDYEKKLKSHDWFFFNRDDSRLREKGQENQDELAKIANESKDHRSLFIKYHKKNFGK